MNTGTPAAARPAFDTCVIIGLGYIGLPTSVVVARSGIRVVGVDVNPRTIAAINAGACPIEEPYLPEALADLVGQGLISAVATPVEGDVFIIAVPTPFTGGFKPDLSYVEAATRSIAPVLRKGNLVIVESTIPVGSSELVARWIETMRPDLTTSRRGAVGVPDILVAHCPERVLPGQMLKELVENDRIIGGVCPASAEAARDFYASFVTGTCLVTDARTAELCKLTENSFRDVNIAFANELAELCEDLGIDVWELIGLANHHPRVNILKPGPGVGDTASPSIPGSSSQRSATRRASSAKPAGSTVDVRGRSCRRCWPKWPAARSAPSAASASPTRPMWTISARARPSR